MARRGGTPDFDDQHIAALATRVGNLADEIGKMAGDVRVMIERGTNRDTKLKDIQQDVAEVSNEINNIAESQRHQLTPDEVKILRTMILGRDRLDWMQGRVKRYFFVTAGVLAAVWTLKDLFAALLRSIAGVLPR